MAENNTPSTNQATAPKKSILDHDASWPLTIVYLGFLIGIYFGQRATLTSGAITAGINTYMYYLVAMFGGLVATFLLYNLGKIIFASAAGYKIIYCKILGMNFDHSGKKTKFSYHITDFFTLALQFAPKDDDTKKNPTLLFVGGFVVEGIIIVATLLIFFLVGFGQAETSTSADWAWILLYMMLYGFLTPLYEVLPFRQDYPTDMFNIMTTRTPDDKKAFNIFQINKRRELSGEDFLVEEFDSYDSYYKAHELYFIYLEDLYASKLEKAFSVLNQMNYYSKYYIEDERYIPGTEMVYLKYLIDDQSGAADAFFKMKSDDRKMAVKPIILSGYRTAILIDSYIHSDPEAIQELLTKYAAKMEAYGDITSRRLTKEAALIKDAYNKAAKNENITLPPYDEVVKKMEAEKEKKNQGTINAEDEDIEESESSGEDNSNK